jgi:hypothetical protein
MTTPRVHTALIGAAGEYYVAAELSRRGWLATVTIKNAPGTDVLAQNVDQPGIVVSTQTKTSSDPSSYRVGAKAEFAANGKREWFVFVGLRDDTERPVFYVVPHDIVAGCIYASHRVWLKTPGRNGQGHRDSAMRKIRAKWIANYVDAWDLLLGPTSDALNRIDRSWRVAALEQGLEAKMPSHPWVYQ